MATIQLNASENMHDAFVWYGSVLSYDSAHITIASGEYSESYYGSFSYDYLGNVYGTLTGVSETYSGSLLYSAYGLSVSANLAKYLIQSGQAQAFLQTALSGNDQFYVSAGSHIIDGYGGYNTLSEPSNFSNYALSAAGTVLTFSTPSTYDTIYNIQSVNFSDGTYNVQSQTFTPFNLSTSTIGISGNTRLVQVGNYFFLRSGSGSGPWLQYEGRAVVAGSSGSWSPIGAEQTAY